MEINPSQFCSIATSPSWQTWLYNFNIDLYRQFILALRESKGCTGNQTVMLNMLQQINNLPDGNKKLIQFLMENYPNSVIQDVFPNYRPGVLTYPRRLIIQDNNGGSLLRQVRTFIADKFKSDYIIINNKAYIEYLLKEDGPLASQIPTKNWKIPEWRSQGQK